MSTKDDELFLKQPLSATDHFHKSNQFFNLNLNQNYKCSDTVLPIHSVSQLNNNKSSGHTVIKEKDKSWNKSSKDLWLKTSKKNPIFKEKAQQRWKNDIKNVCPDKNSNSTLSLHIAAYENSIEVVPTEIKDWPKKSETFKSVESLSNFQDPFEFPRQQESNKSAKPEVQQFKASQKLHTPNQGVASSKKASRDPSTEKSVQLKTAAHDYDNFGNLTTEEATKTKASKEEKRKNTKETISKQSIDLKVEKDAKKPTDEQQLPPEIIELKVEKDDKKSTDDQQPPPPPSQQPVVPESSPAPPPVGNKSKKVKKKSGDKAPKNQPKIPSASAENMQTPIIIRNTQSQSQLERTAPAPSSAAAAAAIVETEPLSQSNNKIQEPENQNPDKNRKEESCWQLLRQGRLRRERPNVFYQVIAISLIFVVFILALIGLGILLSVIL